MIRPLRRRHHLTFLALAVILPIVFVAAILARRAVPIAGVNLPETQGNAAPGTH